MTRGFGFSEKDNASGLQKDRAQDIQEREFQQAGKLSAIPTISCCKIHNGDEFILITTPAISDTMSAQRAVSIGSRALQDSGPMQPSSSTQKGLCFKAAGKIITRAMAVAPGEAGTMAAHVILIKAIESNEAATEHPKESRSDCAS